MPFLAKNNIELIEKIRNNDIIFPDHREVSDGLRDLINKMCDRDVNNRIDIKWILDNNWVNLN